MATRRLPIKCTLAENPTTFPLCLNPFYDPLRSGRRSPPPANLCGPRNILCPHFCRPGLLQSLPTAMLLWAFSGCWSLPTSSSSLLLILQVKFPFLFIFMCSYTLICVINLMNVSLQWTPNPTSTGVHPGVSAHGCTPCTWHVLWAQ